MRDAHIFGLRAVDLVAEDPAAGGAMRIHALAAIFAFAASRDARDQDAVAGTETGDTGADAVHHPDAFVTENAAGLTRRHVPFENVQIGSQMVVLAIFTIASVGAEMAGIGRSSSAFLPGP
jgi:hypothetical protein